ncbi:hypothetical protein E0L36_26105 [Streptomyces sp. AJS327]|uniref:hypothetical protein n=1 Tax=Streptomyces sp. AJS327 TaxID=2545265 RepID=UPI0015E051F6|nr:hypothetical protein [Streptomyces sp. AJS327]MBA0054200.1 hypothetical protein [Streptomyces sp. AJS327]
MSRRRAHGPLLAVAVFGTLLAGCGIRATSVPVDAGEAPSRVACVRPDDSAPDGPGGREDDGAAPERSESGEAETGKKPSDRPGGAKGSQRDTARVYLVCGARVAPVERTVPVPEGRPAAARLPMARKLLAELRKEPESGEGRAGFETAVPDDLRVEAGAAGDPKEALRLSQPPGELRNFALAQIVCTFADTPVGDGDGGVTLGGPRPGGSAAATDADEPGEPSGPAAAAEDRGERTEGSERRAATEPLRRYECGDALRTEPEAARTAGTEV